MESVSICNGHCMTLWRRPGPYPRWGLYDLGFVRDLLAALDTKPCRLAELREVIGKGDPQREAMASVYLAAALSYKHASPATHDADPKWQITPSGRAFLSSLPAQRIEASRAFRAEKGLTGV